MHWKSSGFFAFLLWARRIQLSNFCFNLALWQMQFTSRVVSMRGLQLVGSSALAGISTAETNKTESQLHKALMIIFPWNAVILQGISNFQTTWQECLKNALQEHNCNGVFVHQPMYIHSYIFIDVLIAWTKSWTEKTLLAEERGRVVRESTSFWRAHGGWLCSFVKEFQN